MELRLEKYKTRSKSQLLELYNKGKINDTELAVLAEPIPSFKQFLIYTSAGISDTSLRGYQSDLHVIQKLRPRKAIRNYTKEDFLEVMSKMKSKYKSATVARKYNTLRLFFDYLLDQNEISDIPIPRNYRIGNRLDQTVKSNIGQIHIDAIYKAFADQRIRAAESIKVDPNSKPFYMEQMRILLKKELVIRLLDDTGARSSAVLDIKYSDIEFLNDGRAFVLIRSDKKRLMNEVAYTKVMLTVDTVNHIRQYVRLMDDEGYITSEKPLVDIAVRTLQDWTAELCVTLQNLGFDELKRLEPREFRRFFAKRLIENKIDIAVVAKLMGHNSPNTTYRYTDKITDQTIMDAYARKNNLNQDCN